MVRVTSNAVRIAWASLAPLPNPLPGVPGRGRKRAERETSHFLSPSGLVNKITNAESDLSWARFGGPSYELIWTSF